VWDRTITGSNFNSIADKYPSAIFNLDSDAHLHPDVHIHSYFHSDRNSHPDSYPDPDHRTALTTVESL
jgi:hypothetical protein